MTGRPLTRRTALAGVAAGLTASGCDLSPPRGPRSGRRSGPTEPPPAEPDEALVTRVRDDLAGALAWVRDAAEGRPGLAAELAGFRRLHAEHLAELPGDSAGSDRPRQRVTSGAQPIREALRRRELRLQRALADAAVASDSGALAALLASMSAAVAQRLAAPTAGPSR